MLKTSPARWLCLGLLLIAPAAGQEKTKPDPLALMGLRASEGAAAGYVADTACASCHAALYESYQHVGMARSFANVSQAPVIEDFGREYYHEASQRYYQIRKEGNGLTFKRYQKDDMGETINEFETAIDWVLGSGNRARSYLIQTAWGEMFMLPLGWYSEKREWRMSPGFEGQFHLGLQRPILQQCLFCHNAFPEVPAGSDLAGMSDQFPHDLPQGTGCQRCHGPGANHIRALLNGKTADEVRSEIVNPRKLPAEQRDSVCFQCHMLPAVSLIGVRRFDRPFYSFRPGERISDYLPHVEVEEAGMPREDRFEINHHGYRFWQSRCYQESKGELACISCHNPHVKPESKTFRASVSKVCLTCHQAGGDSQFAVHTSPTAREDCVSCHMPTRRTRDVVEVTMTDHRIARGPFDHAALVRPLEKEDLILTGIELLPFGDPPTGDEGDIYRMVATLRGVAKKDTITALENRLKKTQYPLPGPYMALLKGQLLGRDYPAAIQTAQHVLKLLPKHEAIHAQLGVALLGARKKHEAVLALKKSIEIKASPEGHYNLGLAYYSLKQDDLALTHLEKAINMRPTLYRAWRYKGLLHEAKEQLTQARAAFQRCLEIEPSDSQAYVSLVGLLRRMGENKQADRYLAVGLRVALNPALLQGLKKPEKP